MPSCRPAPAQGLLAAPQPTHKRGRPHNGLECQLQWHMASPLAASLAEAKMPSVCTGQFVSGGNQVPHHRAIKRPQVPSSGDTVTVTEAGMASALVPPNACCLRPAATGCALLQLAARARLLTGGSGVRPNAVLGCWCGASVAALPGYRQTQCLHQLALISLIAGPAPRRGVSEMSKHTLVTCTTAASGGVCTAQA